MQGHERILRYSIALMSVEPAALAKYIINPIIIACHEFS